MAVDMTTIAVVLAVVLPVSIAVLIALVFWCKTQRRFKREEQDDEKNRVYDDEVVTFREMRASSGTLGPGDTPPAACAAGSGSSEGSASEKERSPPPVPAGRATRTYTPAYRRRLNRSLSRQASRAEEATTHSSAASYDTQQAQQAQLSVFEQMVPVLQVDGSGPFANPRDAASERGSRHSSESLMKSLKNQDFGSYPKRRPSATNVGNLAVYNGSVSSFSSRVPSSTTLNCMGDESFYAYDGPARTGRDLPEVKQDVYMLKNNYDVTNNKEITEEDQYENEFTNYSENKREFIDSLRPKAERMSN
ncbi:AaceriAFR300Cp [[Ashbya] aceris (nom. inval.)]|nr:AaceriAFR300Cp [[Ashbya] aceris (nom. inval.)]